MLFAVVRVAFLLRDMSIVADAFGFLLEERPLVTSGHMDGIHLIVNNAGFWQLRVTG